MPKTTPQKSTHPKAARPSAQWKHCTHEMPDSDLTVLIHHPAEDEPVWMGFHDGETWRAVDGARCAVSHWMPLPEPPPNAEVSERSGGMELQ